MNNSKERNFLNMIKRLFCLMVVLTMIATLLPATVFATSKEAVMVTNRGLSVEGTPNGLPIGTGYEFHVVEEKPDDKDNKNLVMQFIDKNHNKQTIYLLNSFREYITWNGLTISRNSEFSAWQTGQYCTFNVADDDSDTTVSSNNITMLDISDNEIKENNTFTVTYQIVDYNVDADQVKSDVQPYLTGFSSGGSFVLNDNSIDNLEKSKIEITPIFDHKSGKFAIKVKLPLRYTGTGSTLSFTIAYKNSSDALRTLDCSTTIPRTVASKEDDDKDDKDDDKASDTLVPYIIVDSYSYGGTSVTAGEEFSLTVRLRNTSTTHSLENIVMNVSPMGVFSMTSSSNTFFITRLQAGSIMERTITLNTGLTKVTDDKDANSIDMKFTYQYSGKDSKALVSGTSNESITIPVDFPDRFELGVPELDTTAFVGEDCYISVPMVNKGRSGVYNLTASVRGDMKNPGQTQYVGNLAAGTESSADFSVVFEEAGEYTGEVVVTYEDANMNPKEVVSVFNVTVEDMGFDDTENPDGIDPTEPTEPVDAEPQEDPVKPVKIVVAIVVCCMSAYMTIQKAKAKRSIFLDEDI